MFACHVDEGYSVMYGQLGKPLPLSRMLLFPLWDEAINVVSHRAAASVQDKLDVDICKC